MELYGQLEIRESRPAWMNGMVRATVTIGSNHYTESAATFREAAQKLRESLPILFAEADANRARGV